MDEKHPGVLYVLLSVVRGLLQDMVETQKAVIGIN